MLRLTRGSNREVDYILGYMKSRSSFQIVDWSHRACSFFHSQAPTLFVIAILGVFNISGVYLEIGTATASIAR